MKRFFSKSGINGRLGVLLPLLGLMLLSAIGCKSKYPPDILRPEQIKPVLFDVMVATSVKQMDTTAATRQHLRDSITLEIHRVLAAHNIDDSLYFRSMAFYEAHPDYLKTLLDSARAYGNNLQDSLQKKRFTAPDTARPAAIQPRTGQPAVADTPSTPKMPVNPTVKDSGAVPVEKVKKGLKKIK